MKRLPRTLFFALLFLAVGLGAAAWQTAAGQSKASSADAAAGIGSAGSTEKDASENKEAAAQEGEDDGTAQFKQSPSVKWLGKHVGLTGGAMYSVAVVVNFAIIALGVVYFSRLHLPTMFRNRTDSIRKAMNEAKVASDEAKSRLAAIEARLSRLDSDIASLTAKAEQDGAAEADRIRAAAEQDKQKIVEAAAQEIHVAATSARRELGAYAADLAVHMAGQRIQVDVAADQALVRGFAASLGKAAQ